MSILKSAATSRTGRAGIALGVAAAAVVGLSASPANAAAATATVSPGTGATTGSVITLTAASYTFKTAGGVSNVHANVAGVQFNQATACPTSEAAPSGTTVVNLANVSDVTIVNHAKIVVKVPTLAAKAYKVCVYKNATTLQATGKFTAYSKPTVSSVTPSSGPVFGGATVTVASTATNFTSKSTVKIGGVAATNVKVATDGATLTATVPANAAGAQQVVVTTEGGSSTDVVNYTYKDGISITPTMLVTGETAGVIDVTGYGFTGATVDFSTSDGLHMSDTKWHVFLTDGVYDPTDITGAKTKPQVAECTGVVVVSDTELVCSLDVSALGDNVYQLAVVNSGAVDAQAGPGYRQTIVSSQSSLTVAPY